MRNAIASKLTATKQEERRRTAEDALTDARTDGRGRESETKHKRIHRIGWASFHRTIDRPTATDRAMSEEAAVAAANRTIQVSTAVLHIYVQVGQKEGAVKYTPIYAAGTAHS